MEFLTGLKDAISHGISKDEYMAIWKQERKLKCSNDETQNVISDDVIADNLMADVVISGGVIAVDVVSDVSTADVISEDVVADDVIKDDNVILDYAKSGNDTNEDSTISLLMQIIAQQNKIQLQQDRMQQQLKDLQMSHEKEKQNVQHQFEKTQDMFCGALDSLEMKITNLEHSFTAYLKQSVHSESLNIQERLSLMTETICNHMLDEMRNISLGRAGGMSKSVFSTDKRKIKVQTDDQIPEETESKTATTLNDGICPDIASGNNSVKDCSRDACFGKEKVEAPPSGEGTESVKKVPAISDSEILFRHTLRHELNEFLVSVQKMLLRPINSQDISFYITDRIEELFQRERNLTADQFLNVQTVISCDIHARLCKMEMCFKQELDRIGSSLEHKEHFDQQAHEILEEIQKLKIFFCSQLPTNSTSHMKLSSVSEIKTSEDLTGRRLSELEAGRFTNDDHTHTNQVERDVLHGSMSKDGEQELSPQPKAVLKNLTDAHLKLMLGQNKEAHYLCDLNYDSLSVDKDVFFLLKDIAPGYNIQLKAKVSEEKGNLKLDIMSLVGKHDDSLTWPAEFSITITLVSKQPMASSKKESWHTFTKRKSLYKPIKTTGKSNPIPICYFRKDIINAFIHEDTLVFKTSVKYVGDVKDTVEVV